MCEEFVPGSTELVELAAVAFFNLFCFFLCVGLVGIRTELLVFFSVGLLLAHLE